MLQAHIGVRKFMWPLLRADFELIETYQPPSLEPLDCDVTAIGARADSRYSPGQVGGATLTSYTCSQQSKMLP